MAKEKVVVLDSEKIKKQVLDLYADACLDCPPPVSFKLSRQVKFTIDVICDELNKAFSPRCVINTQIVIPPLTTEPCGDNSKGNEI